MNFEEILRQIKDFYDDSSFEKKEEEEKEFYEMIEEKRRREMQEKDPYESIIRYFPAVEPKYLTVGEQEEKTRMLSSEDEEIIFETNKGNKKRKSIKTIVAIGIFITIAHTAISLSHKQETYDPQNTQPSIISEEENVKESSNNFNFNDDGTLNDSISDEEVYRTFIQYAKDNNIPITSENYESFANFYVSYVENGGALYETKGGRSA